jgi:hypothetical protein
VVTTGVFPPERPVFVEFLKRLLHNHQGPAFLIVDRHPAHRGKLVSQYVASTEGRLRLFFPATPRSSIPMSSCGDT